MPLGLKTTGLAEVQALQLHVVLPKAQMLGPEGLGLVDTARLHMAMEPQSAQGLVARRSAPLLAQVPEQLLPKGAGAEGIRAEHVHSQFRDVVFSFRGHCGQIVNLLKQPVPFPYFHLLNLMLLVQLVCLLVVLNVDPSDL